MAHLHRSVASIRIMGDNLIPETITTLLGCAPTLAYTKGQIRSTTSTGKEVVAMSGRWSLKAASCKPENIDNQVAELLGKLSSDLSVWMSLSSQYEIDLFCGLFMNESNEGVEISNETLLTLGQRGIKLGLDIYAPD